MYISSDASLVSGGFGDSSNPSASVICSWPLSGQYGPGARTLYYVLAVTCIAAPHVEWMRGACLAAALLFPSVAAIHALVLTSVSETHGPVDLDIFGTFQVCAIGVLAVPITLRYSKAYFETKGRNLVFSWMVLNLAGLLSLIVAFYRASPQPCIDSQNNNVTESQFNSVTANQSSQVVCMPQCIHTTAIRQDPSNQSQWVLAPNRGLTLNTATLLCAACCIPAILSLLSVWQKVMHFNWRKRRNKANTVQGAINEKQPEGLTQEEREKRDDERWMDKKIRLVLGLVERIVFTMCILAIVVLGEMNFWSRQMRAGVEHMNGVGQWGPIVAAALAAFGSFFAVLSGGGDNENEDSFPNTPYDDGQSRMPTPAAGGGDGTPTGSGPGHRARVNKGLFKLLQVLGTPGAERFADEVRTRHYHEYPRIPGEVERNETLGTQEKMFRALRQESMLSRRGSSIDVTAGPSHQADDTWDDLIQQRARTLQVPKRTYTSPREATTIPRRREHVDSPVRTAGPSVPMIIVDDVDS